MKYNGMQLIAGLLLTGSVLASDADQDAHMIERADAWFEKFQMATPEQQAKMLERRNACLKLPEAERRTQCGRGHGGQKGHQNQTSQVTD
jgi:hypothetical protein